MIIGIDASNIRAGGGLAHLIKLLNTGNPLNLGFSRVIIWGGQNTLDKIVDRPWLTKSHQKQLDKGLFNRVFWQRFKLSTLARKAGCAVLFVPGGSYVGNFRPVVTLSQNLLPFQWYELRRYFLSIMTVKLLLLRLSQGHSFRRADGVIFLTHYAYDTIMSIINHSTAKTTIIPHGADETFLCNPRQQFDMGCYSFEKPLKILYVSIIDMYKHQWNVVDAVAQLRAYGLPITLSLVGPAYSPALKRLRKYLEHIDKHAEFINYVGEVPYEQLPRCYAQADLFLFASTCENMPIILLEAMASGLPIACSKFGPMPEILGDAGVYFDPEKPKDIAVALRRLLDSPALRASIAKASFERARDYSWLSSVELTYDFLYKCARNNPLLQKS